MVLILLSAAFGVAYAGFAILVALRTRNVQATNTSFLLFFPLLFLTPNFVPFDRLTPFMEALARVEPGELRDRGPALAGDRGLGARQAGRLRRA